MSLRSRSRWTYIVLRFGLGAAALFLGAVSGLTPLVVLAALWLLVGHYPVKWLTQAILVATVTTVDCPHCGFQLDAIGRWTVGQFTPAGEEHILAVRSKIDGSVVSHTDCPQCGSTILIR